MLPPSMAEWAVLLLVVPAVVVPVVLLLGFAGCDLVLQLHRPTTIVSAVATSRSSITIEWIVDEDDTDSVRLDVFQLPEDTLLPAINNPSSPFEITGLQPGTIYRLQVVAFDDGDTDTSPPVFVETMSLAFDTAADGAPGDQPAAGRCVVQRIEPGRLTASGSRVLIFLRGPMNGAVSIARMFISQPAAAGDPYDSAGDLTRVQFAVGLPDQPLIVQGAGEVALPIVDYVFDQTQPLLIAFDLTPGFPSSVPVVPLMSPVAVAFFQDNLQEAALVDRTTNYQSATGIALIARIEVV